MSKPTVEIKDKVFLTFAEASQYFVSPIPKY